MTSFLMRKEESDVIVNGVEGDRTWLPMS